MAKAKLLCIFLIFVGWISQAVALPEAELATLYPQAVSIFNAAPLQQFAGQNGALIRYKVFAQKNAAEGIVISNGYHEDMGLYAELIFDLFQAGYSVYILDHRGQGLSDRLITKHDRGYIDEFKWMVRDLHSFVNNVVAKNQNTKLHLLSHSMGGAIAALYLETYKKNFVSAVFSAPMLKINTGKWNEVAALEYSRVQCLIGHCDEFAQDPVDPLTVSLENNELTYSAARYKIRTDRFLEEPPGRFFAPSYGWIKEAIAGSRAARMHPRNIHIPILILQATDDTIVIDGPQNKFCSQVQSCELVSFKSKHSIFIGADSSRAPALAKTIEFFQKN
jgi:lysophospholipase